MCFSKLRHSEPMGRVENALFRVGRTGLWSGATEIWSASSMSALGFFWSSTLSGVGSETARRPETRPSSLHSAAPSPCPGMFTSGATATAEAEEEEGCVGMCVWSRTRRQFSALQTHVLACWLPKFQSRALGLTEIGLGRGSFVQNGSSAASKRDGLQMPYSHQRCLSKVCQTCNRIRTTQTLCAGQLKGSPGRP